MGPKGYRICWLGNDKERMRHFFDEGDGNLGEFFFLPYPGAERRQLKEVHPSLLLIDTEGLEGHRKELLRWIVSAREASPRGKVLLLLHNGSNRFVSDALSRGADWVFDKAGHELAMQFCVQTAIMQHKAEKEVYECRREGARKNVFENMIGRTAVMKDLARLIRKCAPSHANVLIRGESGTGLGGCCRIVVRGYRVSRPRSGARMGEPARPRGGPVGGRHHRKDRRARGGGPRVRERPVGGRTC